MAEAEDVITDVARHATIYVQGLWRRHRARRGKGTVRSPPALVDFVRRLDLVATAFAGTSYPIHVAQPPAPPSLLKKLFDRRAAPRLQRPLDRAQRAAASTQSPAAAPVRNPPRRPATGRSGNPWR